MVVFYHCTRLVAWGSSRLLVDVCDPIAKSEMAKHEDSRSQSRRRKFWLTYHQREELDKLSKKCSSLLRHFAEPELKFRDGVWAFRDDVIRRFARPPTHERRRRHHRLGQAQEGWILSIRDQDGWPRRVGPGTGKANKDSAT